MFLQIAKDMSELVIWCLDFFANKAVFGNTSQTYAGEKPRDYTGKLTREQLQGAFFFLQCLSSNVRPDFCSFLFD